MGVAPQSGMMMRFRPILLSLLCASGVSGTRADPAGVPLGMAGGAGGAVMPLPQRLGVAFPGEVNVPLAAAAPGQWLRAEALHLTVAWPDGKPERVGALVWLKDRDAFWHQYLIPQSGEEKGTNLWVIPFRPGAAGWQTPGHTLAWHHRVRLNPQSVGVRLFGDSVFTGKCVLVSAALAPQPSASPPEIAKVRPLTRSARAYALYEARFDLPDRYDNPFDPGQIDAGAIVITPSGLTNAIHAFYYQPHYRLEDELGQPVEPDGQPEWRIRYCPREAGEHRVSLVARDAHGETTLTNALRFQAAPADPEAMRFIRVSQKDPRFFESDDGRLFYPIGHNVRSATDSRMDDKFPWVFRQEEGPTAYRRYFSRMRANGENIAEVWMSAWSLGLEWTEGVSGYHGANDYHMGNAWELDRVIDLAHTHRLYINLVLNYHGRISTWCDPEWHLHPYNKATPGGWLTRPLEFFSDERAMEMQRRFCRYTQARWGWAPAIFGYELCSEINLTGHETHHKTHFDPAVVAWCRTLGGYLKNIDAYGHLVSAHVSNDYTFLNPALCNLAEVDFNPLDAYHHGQPERIIPLVAATADAGAAFSKPILITEFGGSPMAAGREHLLIEQHAALWAGACVPLSGVPMFWWWQVVDENDLYGRYAAVKTFMTGIDPRNVLAKRVKPVLGVPENGDAALLKQYDAVGTAAPETLRGYVYPVRFARGGGKLPVAAHLTVTVSGMTPGIFRVEVCETATGNPVRRFDVRTADGALAIPLPPFSPDCAFKAHLLTPLAAKPAP